MPSVIAKPLQRQRFRRPVRRFTRRLELCVERPLFAAAQRTQFLSHHFPTSALASVCALLRLNQGNASAIIDVDPAAEDLARCYFGLDDRVRWINEDANNHIARLSGRIRRASSGHGARVEHARTVRFFTQGTCCVDQLSHTPLADIQG